MKTILALVAATLFIAASCNDKANSTMKPLSATNVAGTYKLIKPASKFAVTLVLTPDSASSEVKNRVAFQIGGRSAVNQYFASLTGSSVSSEVQISTIGATKMAGSPDAMQFESDYFKKLQAVKKYEVVGNQLRLIAEGANSGVLVYEKEK
jgi:heat shock protein HslJ